MGYRDPTYVIFDGDADKWVYKDCSAVRTPFGSVAMVRLHAIVLMRLTATASAIVSPRQSYSTNNNSKGSLLWPGGGPKNFQPACSRGAHCHSRAKVLKRYERVVKSQHLRHTRVSPLTR
jgi:hypothetical protein